MRAPVLAIVVLAGAALRFATLGEQSLWFDESLTRAIVLQPVGDLVSAVVDTENTPPLFYVLDAGVSAVAGHAEIGLRLLSAACGTATIGVAYLAGRELAGARAGLVGAALVAVNPLLVWYSQEARSYALLVLFTAAALWCFLRARRTGAPRDLAGWAVASAAALATHYFAIFPAAAEAALLLLGSGPLDRGRRVVAVGCAALAAAAVAPVAITQERSGRAASVTAEGGLLQRVAQIPKQFLVGYDAPASAPLAVLAAALVAAALIGLWRLRDRDEVRAVALVAAASVLVPVLAALAGADYLNTRNVLPGLVPVLVLAGAGLAARIPVAIGLAATGLVAVVGVALTPSMQRSDWRSLARALGDAPGPRLLVVSPHGGDVALRPYRAGVTAAGGGRLRVREIDLAGLAARAQAGAAARPPAPAPVPAPPPGFAPAGVRHGETFTLFRYRAAAPRAVDPAAVLPRALGPGGEAVRVP